MSIIRGFPEHEELSSGPKRITKEEFDAFMALKTTENFTKWLAGINPQTGRKCQIGGKTHNHAGRMFKYRHAYYCALEAIVDPLQYMQESDEQYRQYEHKVAPIIERNKDVDAMRERIKNLKWNETLQFREKQYGIPEIVDNTHRENDCNGEIIVSREYNPCSCHTCEDWSGYGRGHSPVITEIYTCKKCGGKH
jgi:hypothetical protein